ncbi:tape measure protein [Leclercia sp. G3L]|uniref:tape measure protein n=1 Tax=Leclercia sp. G3L TaxID=2898725 RepID=UPI001E52D55E|nr:tape measure protein [Leclercia sp. G3L]UGB02107.1 tape measure protein [Leclercia sp. G3L]
MNDKVGSYYVDIDADVRKLLSGAHEADEALKIIENSVKKTEKSANKLDSSLNQLGGGFSRLAVAVKGYISIQALMKLQQVSEEFTLLQARVTRLSSSAEVGAKSFQQLVNIASVSGASLGDTVNLWQQLTATLKTVGATNSDVNRLVLTLQKIGTIGGSSSQEMANALRQFMQSVAAGRIQAEEFNSVLEQMPELARQIAAGMGVPYDQLRQLMLAGKLDIGEVLAALEKQSGEVNQQFETMPRTVTQATNALITQFGVAISKIDNAIGASRYLAKLLDGAALNVSLAVGNAPDAVLLTQKLAQNTEQLAVAESDLALARKAGVGWGIKQTQQTVDRLKRERAMILMAQQASKDAQSVYTPSKGEKPAYITNLEKKTAENNANAIIQSGQTLVDKLTKQREKLSQYKAQGLLDDKKYADATAVLDKQIAEARQKQDKAPKNAFARGDESINSLQRQIEVLTMRYDDNTREAAQYNAVAALGTKATDAQKAKVSELAGTLFDAQQRQKDLNDAISNDPVRKENKSYTDAREQLKRQLDGQMIDQKTHDQQSEQLAQQHQINLAKIRAQQVVSPQQAAKGEIDPVQQLANQHAQELALIQQFETQKGQITQRGLELANAANTQYEQQRIAAQWEIFRNQTMANELLAVSLESMQSGAANALTGLLNGTQSVSEAFANLGTSVINGVVSSLVQMGTQWVMSAMMGQAAQTGAIAANQAAATAALAASTLAGTAAATTLLSAWSPAAMAASIATSGGAATAGMAGYTTAMAGTKIMAVAGAREHGGPVNANSMYRVGEGGKPEIFKASNGSQYMIPGDNGRVISNRDIGGGGGGFNYSPVIQVNGDPTEQTLAMLEAAVKRGAQQGYAMAVSDIASGKGKLSNALTNGFNTSRRLT